MKENYLMNTKNKDDFNIVGMYFLEHNLLKNKNVNDEELLVYLCSNIEAATIKNCIDDIKKEHSGYLEVKNREMRWLAAKSRFRAKSNLIP